MTKKDLIDYVNDNGFAGTRVDAEKAVDGVLDGIAKGLKKNGKVTLTGFGNFEVKKTKARMGRNPATGETIRIPAKRTLKFRVAKAAKDAILGKK